MPPTMLSANARKALEDVETAMSDAYRMLLKRDEMNAAVHVDDTRKSPLTIEVEDARTALRRVLAGEL